MAHDNTIPHGKPGIASFESESWGNADEVLFGDTPPVATQAVEVTAAGDLDLPIYSVVNVAGDGTLTMAVYTPEDNSDPDNVIPASSNATHILASPVVMANGATMSIPVIVAGHFRQQALNFDASFNTDALKQAAFKGSDTPMILISKAQYSEADFPA